MKTKKKRNFTVFAGMILFVALLADIKYKGKFYQLLPHSVKSFLDD